MVDSARQEQEAPNLDRKRFIQGAAVAAGAGFLGGFGLRGLFSGKLEPESPLATPTPTETPRPSPTPDTSGGKFRTWERHRPDGTFAYTYPLTPEERVDLNRDVDNVGRAVREVFDADALKASGLDLDKVVAEMKAWDDKTIAQWAHRSNTDRGRFDDLEEVALPLAETGIWAWYVDEPKTGEFGALYVSVPVNENGQYVKVDDKDTVVSQKGLLGLPRHLLPLVKPPKGASPTYSHAHLSFSSDIVDDPANGELFPYDLNSLEYPTADNQRFKLFMSGGRGPVYNVSVFQHKPGVDLTIRGKGGELKLP